MKEIFLSPRGTSDFFEKDLNKHKFVKKHFKELCHLYDIKEIKTPIFEKTEVFLRSLNDATDIVSKELYEFLDKSGESLSLRPEGTAGIIRAYLSNKLERDKPLRLYYSGAMFRYERPQKGRMRQFHQLGLEFIGEKKETSVLEILCFCEDFLKRLNLKTKVSLLINHLGGLEERKKYIKDLKVYLKSHLKDLSPISQKRFEKNPLRILDSKEKNDQKILKKAPQISEFLSPETKKNKKEVLSCLKDLKIPYIEDPYLVRGLDYYEDFVFEFISSEDISQNALIAGGCYKNLSKKLGGKTEEDCIGFAAGLERICLFLDEIKEENDQLMLIDASCSKAFDLLKLSCFFRKKGLSVKISHQSLKKSLKKAQKQKIAYCLITGLEELKENEFMFKKMRENEEKKLHLEQIVEEIKIDKKKKK